jgi:hypothetical protein
MARCKAEDRRYARVEPKIVRVLQRCAKSRTPKCRALGEHIAADLKELEAYIAKGKCPNAAVVLDHLELIGRKY